MWFSIVHGKQRTNQVPCPSQPQTHLIVLSHFSSLGLLSAYHEYTRLLDENELFALPEGVFD